MPIASFQGHTFVAYTDIAGFKSMMSDGDRGPAALDALYSAGYHVIAQQSSGMPRVEGIFVSDCGILFVCDGETASRRLESLLTAVEALNRRCFENAVSLTTAIAWGDFSYRERIEIPGIEKNPVYGNAYVSAFIDNETGSPKLFPNECRIVNQNLPQDVTDLCTRRTGPVGRRIRTTQTHFYFEWMRPVMNPDA
jgi:hypothetical protein